MAEFDWSGQWMDLGADAERPRLARPVVPVGSNEAPLIGDAAPLADGLALPTAGIVGVVPLHSDDAGGLLIPRAGKRLAGYLAVAGATTTQNGADIVNRGWRGLWVIVEATAAGGAGLTPRVQLKSVGGAYVSLAWTQVLTAAGTYTYVLYPGVSAGGTQAVSSVLPPLGTLRVVMAHGDATPSTYAVSIDLIP